MLKSKLLTVLAASSMLSLGLAVTGCDDTLQKEETVKVRDDGTVVHDKKEVTEKPDGTIVKEETHSKTQP